MRRIALLGVCGIPAPHMQDLLKHGVPDDITWLWPGSYIAIESTSQGTKVWTDLGSANPIYVRTCGEATAWASSARLLASLNSTELDLSHLVHRIDPPETITPDSGSTHFAGVRRVPAGHCLDVAVTGQQRIHQTWHSQPSADMPHAQNLRSALEGPESHRYMRTEHP